MRIGFIGLGAMGSGIAGALARGGEEVIAWNRSTEAVDRLSGQGVRRVESPAAAFDAEVVFSMLADDDAVEEVIVKSGAIDRARAGVVHVNLSTISVGLAGTLEADHRRRGLGYVAAPVLGRPDVAAAGGVAVLMAGAPPAKAKVRPLLERVSRAVFDLGDRAPSANVVKLACNFALASMIETLGEAGALAKANGVEPAQVFEVMTSTLFAAPAYRVYAPLIAERRYEPAGFRLPLGLKDVRLALEAAEAKNAALPIGSLLRDRFLGALARGDGDKDWSALAEAAFRDAGL